MRGRSLRRALLHATTTEAAHVLHSGRHAARRDPARARAFLLPAVLLMTSGSALGGMAVLPAVADEPRSPRAGAAPAPPQVPADAPNLRASAHGRSSADTAVRLARVDRADRASRARRSRPAPVSVAAAPRPTPPRYVRPGEGPLTSTFGPRWGRLHAGIDLASGVGAPVRAVTAGTVTSVRDEGGYGLCVRVRHAGEVVTLYGHLSASRVRPGQRVQAGQVIAAEGNSGHSTGPHLHFEIRVKDVPVDPRAWLRGRGLIL